MIVATAGHIDHGKTSLVKALTGVDTDRLPEEKSRGMTIDLGFAYWPLDGGERVGFVDVPGHERFIRNMLAGVTGIDFVLLVVAADDGVMPQTRRASRRSSTCSAWRAARWRSARSTAWRRSASPRCGRRSRRSSATRCWPGRRCSRSLR